MATRVSTAPPRGMRDILPSEVELRDAATQQILSVYRGFGFRRIETPALAKTTPGPLRPVPKRQ